jgi:hypothetical protein
MAETPDHARLAQIARELVVPAIMLTGIGFYLYDAAGLSSLSLMFPGLLIAVIVGALLWLAAVSVFSSGATAATDAQPGEDEETAGPILDARPWLLVLIPALVLFAFEYLGALLAMIALVVGAQFIFGIRSPLKGLAIAVAVVVPTYVFFQHFLYVRFPHGLLGLG